MDPFSEETEPKGSEPAQPVAVPGMYRVSREGHLMCVWADCELAAKSNVGRMAGSLASILCTIAFDYVVSWLRRKA